MRAPLPLVLLVLAPIAAAPAHASEVLHVDGGRASVVEDPFLPAGGDLPAAPVGECGPAVARSAQALPRARASGPSVRRVLRDAERDGRISSEEHDRYRATYDGALALRGRLSGARRNELHAVIRTLESIASRELLTASRMRPLFLQLDRNAEFWRSRSFPRPRPTVQGPCGPVGGGGGGRVTFGDSPLVFQYYPGRGLQLQPLANFGKANALAKACTPVPQPDCQLDELRALLDAMLATSVTRGGFRAWEYYFAFGGGAPPWISGLAQGTGIQALARGSRALLDARYLDAARSALGAFETRSPVGVRAAGDRGAHYLIYSFAPGLRVLNAFIQALVGLHDYAEISGDARGRELFADGDRAARRETPRYDTGAWSLYSLGGRESDLSYHRLVRDFLRNLCERTRTGVYCDTAERFTRYLSERTRMRYRGAPGRPRARRAVAVRFSISKVSCVRLQVKRGRRVVHAARASFGRGRHAFNWVPRAAGRYTVRLEAIDARNHHTVVTGRLVVRR
jgi:hypothetical protein